ncbi:hypothetical protein MF271_05070 [Deinococcus sp. KNUC1210]|uniref:hypothetical protein n=1 Tax=Deinococcus sp. KNUC1210 TaxID=2917691 RepID=UPI001EF04388|nr:hypothetical protein [Deinococcus sp. KNUC1210]ULH16007.1 hypothetical protein MF271_05070 [Deinococcus sp. KNUC1210]
MTRNTAMSMVAQFLGRQNTIPVPVPFVRMLGDYESAALLAQCLYWGDCTDDPSGWFYKTHEEWADELELSADQVRRCVKTCGGMIEVKRKGIPARNYYRANRDAVAAALEGLASERQHATTRSGETQHQDPGNPHDRTLGNPTTVRRETQRQVVRKPQDLITEPTSEPTQNLRQNKHTPPLAADAAVHAPERLEKQEPPSCACSGLRSVPGNR